MSTKNPYQIVLWLVLLILIAFVAFDCILLGYVAVHYSQGGAAGVRAWIVHVEQVPGPLVWRHGGNPTELAVREVMSAYEHFALLVLFLGFGTWLALRLHSWLKKRLKMLPAAGSVTGSAPPPIITTNQG